MRIQQIKQKLDLSERRSISDCHSSLKCTMPHKFSLWFLTLSRKYIPKYSSQHNLNTANLRSDLS